MASPCKKTRYEAEATYTETGFIRVCDAFVRTEGDVISPFVMAEESVRVMFKLRRALLQSIVEESSNGIEGLNLGLMEWVQSAADDRHSDGNIFMPYIITLRDEKIFETFKDRLTTKLSQSKAKNTLIDKLETKSTILQPLISERDFNLYKIKLCSEILYEDKEYDPENDPEATVLKDKADNIKALLKELQENRVKIGLLSRNGLGKSFFLNVLFLLSSDSEQEYKENNKDIKLPKDYETDKKIKAMTDQDIQMFPQVIQDVITEIKQNSQSRKNEEYFKSFAEKCVHTLNSQDDEDNSLSEIKNYFTGSRIVFEPYILAQKDGTGSHRSTTKCIIYLRYGPLYQMKVEYYSVADLQYQLFDLAYLTENETSERNAQQKKAYKTLKARLALLTGLIDYDNDDNDDNDDNKKIEEVVQPWRSYKDIKLSSDVMKFAGSMEIYIGNGKSAVGDRLALKSVLKKLTTSQKKDDQEIQANRKKIAALKTIIVYLPSKILLGNEILEMPGIDESDPLAIDCITRAMDEVDIVFLLSEYSFKTGAKEVKERLMDSRFFQNFLIQPSNYKLVLLFYNEKDSHFQYQKKHEREIQELEHEAKDLRKSEIQYLQMQARPHTLSEESVYSSYILPLLHISINCQEGASHEIIEQHKLFLKHTGVTNLIIELDTFAAKKQGGSVQEILDKMELAEVNEEMDVATAKTIVDLLRKRENKIMYDKELTSGNKCLLTELKKNLEETILKFLNEKISDLLTSTLREAAQRWKDNEVNITSIQLFNPFYNGNYPSNKVKICNILFEGIVKKAKELFTDLIGTLKRELAKYEKNAIELLTKYLTALINSLGISWESTQLFVDSAVKQSLEDATSWYIGKIQTPFSEKTLEKYFQQSINTSLKNNLKPAFVTKNLSEAKAIMKDSITKTIMFVYKEFKKHLDSLSNKRYNSFNGKVVARGKFRMWQILMGKIESISKVTEETSQVDKLKKAKKLMSIKLHDIPE